MSQCVAEVRGFPPQPIDILLISWLLYCHGLQKDKKVFKNYQNQLFLLWPVLWELLVVTWGKKKIKSEYQNHDAWGEIRKICFYPIVIICGWEPVCLLAEYMSNRMLIPAAMWGCIFFHQDKSNTDYQLSDTSFTNKELDPPVITFTVTSMSPLSGPKFGLESHF